MAIGSETVEEAPRDADGGAAERDWSGLQPELLELITRKIDVIEDFVRFGTVCKPWRSATIPTNLKPQVPWAVLPYDPKSSIRRFYSVSTNTLHTLDLPECRGRIIAGTAHGWLVMADITFSRFLSLFNPLTRALIRLPSITTSPTDNVAHLLAATSGGKQSFVSAYMFMDRGEFIVVVCSCFPPRISCYRKGDEAWTTIGHFGPCYTWAMALAYHDGRLYALDKTLDVRVCDLRRGADAMFVLIPSLQPPTLTPAAGYQFGATPAGELVLTTIHAGPSRGQVQFCVYKADAAADQPPWSKARGIGDDLTLFVSSNGDQYEDFITFVDGDASRCKKNCAYCFGSVEILHSRGIQIHCLDENGGVPEYIGRGMMAFLGDPGFRPHQNFVTSTWMKPSLCREV